MLNNLTFEILLLCRFSVETRRWFVFGRAVNDVLVPSVLPILEKYVSDEYHLFLKSESSLHGHSKNGFTVRNGMNKKKSDVIKHLKLNEITSPVEYAKCFLENDMMNFNAFDETCDASVVLHLFGNMDCFPVALQNTANAVQKGRNMWAHCNPNEWVDDEFKQRFHDMKQLVVQVGLPASHERKVLADLNYYEGKGTVHGVVMFYYHNIILFINDFRTASFRINIWKRMELKTKIPSKGSDCSKFSRFASGWKFRMVSVKG